MDISIQLGLVVGVLMMAIGCIGSCIICESGGDKSFGWKYYLNILMLLLTMVGSVLVYKFS